ncbi:MAG: ion transporter [Caldilineaceae bacterium]|nr:ion transporter [Caldilineaceae bacterium]
MGNSGQRTRAQIGEWIEHPRQQTIIIAVILFNAVTLGLETVPAVYQRTGGLLHLLDQIIIGIFVVEIGLKLIGSGLRFFRSAWNLFDFVIVAISLVPAASALSILRTLRVFRLLRLLNKVPRLRLIIEAMLQAIPSISWVLLMLVLVFYIFAVIGTTLFGPVFPEWFGDLGASAYTLFQVMTLESWSMGIARPVIEEFPYAFLFFIPFILVATFTMLNLFIAIIVNAMQSLHAAEEAENLSATVPLIPVAQVNDDLLVELRQLQARMARIEAALLSGEHRQRTADNGERGR